MKWYPWLCIHLKKLIAGYQEGKWHPTLLIEAVPGMGDDTLICAFTRFLTCLKKQVYMGCEKCRSCRLMIANNHPDYYILFPEKGKNTISVNTVREISEKIYECPQLSSVKIVNLNTDLLTEVASNALLKILEEPPNHTYFFLNCRNSQRLPKTLRSRCRLYRLLPPKELFSLEWIKREIDLTLSKETILSALRICGGAPIAALELLQETERTKREYFFSLLKLAIESSDWLSLLEVLNQDRAPDLLYWLFSLLLDALKIQFGSKIISNLDNQNLLKILAHLFPSTVLLNILYEICDCRNQLLSIAGINRELLLTNQLLRIEDYLERHEILSVSRI